MPAVLAGVVVVSDVLSDVALVVGCVLFVVGCVSLLLGDEDDNTTFSPEISVLLLDAALVFAELSVPVDVT